MSRLSISNIAWDPSADREVARLLLENDVQNIDLAPTKYLSDLNSATDRDLAEIRNFWASYGVNIVGFQSLLFGTSDLNVFGSRRDRDRTISHLRTVAKIARTLGAQRLVFGSPKNRDRTGLDDQTVEQIYLDFFSQLGDVGREYELFFCLEPNPEIYECNFMTTSVETAQVVRAVDDPNVLMQFDTGALEITGENALEEAIKSEGLIGHIHLSSRNLMPAHLNEVDTATLTRALEELADVTYVTIEQRDTGAENNLLQIERSLHYARSLGVIG